MWCTRWFLPLLLLPLPTAPPYFLILFLFSLTMHAKPCFYCIVLLTTLFITSCYWQPFPMDSPLTTPWSDNITTFAEALNSTLMSNYSQPLPTVMRAVDRCWCDFSSGGFFEPFNVSHWEYLSVRRMSNDLTRQKPLEDNLPKGDGTDDNSTPGMDPPTDETLSVASPSLASTTSEFWWRLWSLSSTFALPSVSDDINTAFDTDEHSTVQTSDPSPTPSPESLAELPLLRREYDLRPYGFGMIIDLGWSR